MEDVLTDLRDARVDEAYRTCRACPEQYEGRLVNGLWFYYRYRWGHACIGVGETLDDAVEHSEHHCRDYGGFLDGQWRDVCSRNSIFRELLTEALDAHHS